jgi:hypothetical protein
LSYYIPGYYFTCNIGDLTQPFYDLNTLIAKELAMRSLTHNILLCTMTFVFIVYSCKKDDPLSDKGQPVYFQYSYVNYAWGYQHSGWLIDNKGNVNYYNLPNNWRYEDSDGISYDDLIYNLSQADSVIAKIDLQVLNEKIKLIHEAIGGTVSPRVNTAYDAGGSTLSAFYYDNITKKYRSVILAESGDFSSYNKSAAAIQLTNWLKQFGVFWLSDIAVQENLKTNTRNK